MAFRTNVVFALFPPLAGRHRGKAARKEAYVERARKEIEWWIQPADEADVQAS